MATWCYHCEVTCAPAAPCWCCQRQDNRGGDHPILLAGQPVTEPRFLPRSQRIGGVLLDEVLAPDGSAREIPAAEPQAADIPVHEVPAPEIVAPRAPRTGAPTGAQAAGGGRRA